MFNWIRSLFKPLAKAGDSIQPAEPFVWCLVGNIVAEHTYGEQKQVKQGSKHFTPNTKVYCMPAKWGDGYENITVIGKLRRSRRLITVVMPSAQITNWRATKVYSPKLLALIQKAGGWTNSEKDCETITDMARFLNQRK